MPVFRSYGAADILVALGLVLVFAAEAVLAKRGEGRDAKRHIRESLRSRRNVEEETYLRNLSEVLFFLQAARLRGRLHAAQCVAYAKFPLRLKSYIRPGKRCGTQWPACSATDS